MEIAWYGLSCFRLTERGKATVVTDPYDSSKIGFSPLKLKADIVSISHESPGHNYLKAVRSVKHVLGGLSEYEIADVCITAIMPSARHNANGPANGNTIHVFDYDGVFVAELGDLPRSLQQSEVDALGAVDVALVPVGGGSSLNAAQAAAVISTLEPGIVIPMHFRTKESSLKLDPLSKFIKEMGLGAVQPAPSLKVTKSSIPGETQVVVLDAIG